MPRLDKWLKMRVMFVTSIMARKLTLLLLVSWCLCGCLFIIAQPQEPAAGLAEAAALARAGRRDEAVRRLEDLARAVPSDPGLLLQVLEALLDFNQIEPGRRLLGRLDKLELSADEASNVWQSAGALFAVKGHFADAARCFDAGRRFKESGPLLFNLALARYNLKDYAAALSAIDSALAREDAAESHSLRGSILEGLGRIPEAVGELRRAIEKDPSDESNWRTLGVMLTQHLQFDQAVEVFEAAAVRFPRAAGIQLGLGVAQYLRGTDDKAIVALLRAVNLDSALEIAVLFLGNTYAAAAEQAPAVLRCLAQMAEMHPSSYLTNYHYGAALLVAAGGDTSRPEFASAEIFLKKARLLDPRSSAATYQLAEIRRLRGDRAGAIALLQQVTAVDPRNAEAHYKLARLYSQAGRPADAERELALHEKTLKEEGDLLERRFQEVQKLVTKISR